ncbi:hypothetical protein POTOM_029418 [Populus tomentosa]|uniref:60S ribosomal protein L35a-3 n=1 Tax=Populus tomentosa TaxID=118781 RepID=A0A8X8CTZ0_POPTO|nr:hypothetical protein POTOM_029418 [Populus tomentosa]
MVKGRQGERVRLYVRGTILGYKRSKSNQYPNTSLIQIEGVNTKEEVAWYAGKRMAYIYKAKVKKQGSHYRCIWGKVTRPHGNSGVVRAKFKSNLPPKELVLEFSCIRATFEMDCNALMILHCKCISLGSEWGGLNRILNTPVLHYPPKLSKSASVLSNCSSGVLAVSVFHHFVLDESGFVITIRLYLDSHIKAKVVKF